MHYVTRKSVNAFLDPEDMGKDTKIVSRTLIQRSYAIFCTCD